MAERREPGEPAGAGSPGDRSGAAGDPASGTPLALGAWLRATRLRRGFSYADIERDTRINRLYLEALEDEHFEAIPAPVYTRGFVRSYARALGLDPEEAIAMLPAELPLPPGLEPPAAMRAHEHDAPAFAMPSLPQLRLPPLPLGMQSNLVRWGGAAAGALVLIAAAFFVPRLFGGDAPAAPGATATPTAAAPAATVPAAATVAATPRPAGTGTAAPDTAPNLVGMRQEAAQQALQSLGVTWVTVGIASNEAPEGQVVGQSPAAGAPLKRGDNMTLVVSRGPARN